MFETLARKLLLIVAVGVVAIYASAVAAWRLLELPNLYEREYLADGRYVERIQSIFLQRIREIEHAVVDYGAWTETYEFLGRDPADPVAVKFITSELDLDAHSINLINGMEFVDTQGNSFYSTNFDLTTGMASPETDLDLMSLDRRIYAAGRTREGRIINSGFAASNLGVILFASTPVLKSDRTGPARGVLVFWKLLDASVVTDVERSGRTDLELIPAAAAREHPRYTTYLDRLLTSQEHHLPRTAAGNLYWLLRDFLGRPVYLARLAAEPRTFYDGWLSPPFLAAFLASGLVLLLVIGFFSRTVIRRITHASAIVERISAAGDFHERLPIHGDDELARMFTRFNKLLEVITFQDKELRARNERLEELSRHDPLTEVPNRRFLDETLDRTWRQVVRAGRSMSVLLIDVDYFKAYNDNYGHVRGDQVLKQVARTLQDNLHRATDYLARYGGEEFCVILTDTGLNEAMMVAESLRAAVEAFGIRHDFSGCARVITVSIGVSSITPDQKVLHMDLVGEADKALYRAKHAGRNRVETIDGQRATKRNSDGKA